MKHFCRFCNRFIDNNEGVLVHDDVVHPLEYVYRDDSQEPFAYYINTPFGYIYKDRKNMTNNDLTLEWAGKLAWIPLYEESEK